MRVVIIGNGVAGMEAALTIRQREADWPITIISEESDHFFSRTALMYVLSGQLSHRCIEPLERSTYERSGFTRVRARAVGLDVEGHAVLLADGERVPYDKLIVACGSRPRPAPFWPGYELTGIGHFVTLQDLTWLEDELHDRRSPVRPPNEDAHLARSTPDSPYQPRPTAAAVSGHRARKPVVIGGGLIGIEVVETMLAAGLRPTFLVREDSFWPIALDRREAAWIAEELRRHGCEVRLDENVVRFEGERRVERVVTDQVAHEADLVVVAIGVVPNTDWIGDALRLDEKTRGVLVDRQLCASHPDVFACGDCAAVRWFDGQIRPEQLWYTSRDQGRVAARAVLGDDVGYERGTFYNSAKLMDVEYTTAGLVNMDVEDEESWFHEETGVVRSTTRVVHVDGRVIGFNLLGRRWDTEVLIRWIEERRGLSWVLAHLHEAAFDTELVPALKLPSSAA